MGTKNKVPEIRFKGLSEEWEEKELTDEVTFYSGLTYSPSDVIKEFGTFVLRSSNVKGGEIIGADDVYVNSDAVNSENVRIGDIVVVVRNGSRSLIGKHAQVKQEMNKTVIGAFMTGIHAKHSNFINALLDTNQFTKEIEKNLGATINQITTGSFKKMQFWFAHSKEQTKIGNYFQQLDTLITQHQQKHDKLLNIKKALLEKMFPKQGEDVPEIRFKGFSGAWEERELNNIGEATSGTSIESEFSKDGKYKVVSIGSYSEKSIYTDQGIRAHLSKKTKVRILNSGDLTMILNDKTSTGNIIGRALLILEDDAFIYNQRTQRIEPYRDKHDSLFLYQLFNAPFVREKIIKQSQGNTQIYVNWSAIKRLLYLIPEKKEQIKIGKLFQQMDTLLTQHQTQLKKLKNIKQACLEKMFV